MPSSLTNVMQTADVSTSAADFVAPGTAAPGSTGRLADAGHVHPGSGSWSLGYEIVSTTVSSPGGGLTYGYGTMASVSLAAPTGKKVVGGGYTLATGTWTSGVDNGKVWGAAIATYEGSAGAGVGSGITKNGPASDGSAWEFEAFLVPDSTGYQEGLRSITTTDIPASVVMLTVYAICIAT